MIKEGKLNRVSSARGNREFAGNSESPGKCRKFYKIVLKIGEYSDNFSYLVYRTSSTVFVIRIYFYFIVDFLLIIKTIFYIKYIFLILLCP